MRQKIILFLICLLAFPVASFAQSGRVTANVLQRVFLIKYGNHFGSSFTVDVGNRQYLISAKHLLSFLQESDIIDIYHESQWKKLEVKRIDLKNPKIDILVLAPAVQLSPPLELDPSIDNIILSQNVYFLGFPFGMYVEAKDLNNFFPMPFVKKGIVSAMAFENKKEKIIFIDGYNNKGFSGGPIVFFDFDVKKFKVAAVVSGYKPQRDDIINNKDKATALKAITNSGLLIGYTIDAAIDAIKNNPIGAEIKSK